MGSARIKSGRAGADVIAAADQMTFDWVPDAGNSWTKSSSDYDWNGKWVTKTYASPSSAHGLVVFDTPAFAQAFVTGPSNLDFHSTSSWGHDISTFHYYAGSWWNEQWTWNPVSGVLDPVSATSLPTDLHSYITYQAYQVSYHFDQVAYGYPGTSTETEHGHWAVRQTGDLIAHGGAGNDRIYGGTGNDTLFGAAGDDEIYGGLGTAFLSGGQGKDLLVGGGLGQFPRSSGVLR
jgi:Ca2+-binding RTX toxin-like protein